MKNLEIGREFYYADRNLRRPIKCQIKKILWQLPPKILAMNTETNENFLCYDGFGCYELEDYDAALADSQIQENRLIY